jgi:2-polyprenyl-3-methyl-5-hydroxy-6-metoxy-1,4-benzoquinol methylase
MMKPDFSQRSTLPELMDAPMDFDAFHGYLKTLSMINRLTLAYQPTLRWLAGVLPAGQPASILDVGSGGGDMLRCIWKWSARHKIKLNLTGVDLNPLAKQSAEQDSSAGRHIRFETANIFELDSNLRADFIISSLFAHHLTDEEIIRFIHWMNTHAARGWFINDLHRHPLPYYFIKYFTRIFGFNRMVQHDAPLSVARAFTRVDWRRLLTTAGVPPDRACIRWHFPFRYCIAVMQPE